MVGVNERNGETDIKLNKLDVRLGLNHEITLRHKTCFIVFLPNVLRAWC